MRITWIELRDFRNHRETRLEPPDGLCVAVGVNGEGKTNLLEGMYYLLSLASPRTSSDQPLVRHGQSSAFLRGEVETAMGRPLIEIEVRGSGANRVQVNRSPVRRRADVRRLVRAVFFGPGDLAIVQADPDARRGFMDEATATLWPAREGLARAYERALRQRNRLLKEWEGRGAPPGLGAWDSELVRTGVLLTAARAEAVARVAPLAEREFRGLSGYGLDVRYAPSVSAGHAEDTLLGADPATGLEEGFRARLAERREDELIRRTTLVGPHRDDLALAVKDLGARSFASHGEAWGAALSLRLGLAAAITAEAGDPPVLLLDDPFSALDPERRARVARSVQGRGQTFISVADPGQVPENAAVVWNVRAGEVTAATPDESAAGARPAWPGDAP